MQNLLKNIFEPFLTNEIIVNWLAPIITGLIVLALPTIIIKIFQIKKDEKKISNANQRYLDSIRLYIIQKIKVDRNYIHNIRQVIIKESNIKEKYIYTEVEVRNKLILDITEDNYINEFDKKELIDFAYEVFKGFNENKDTNIEKVKNKKSQIFSVNKYIVLLVLSLIICTINQVISKSYNIELDENLTFSLSTITALVSIFAILLTFYDNLLSSRVSTNSSLKKKLFNLFFEEVEVDDKKRISNKDNKIKKRSNR